MKLYRYTSEGEGIFVKERAELPDSMIDEGHEARSWLPNPTLEGLPEGEFSFYLKEKGNSEYKNKLLPFHKKFLKDIECEEIEREVKVEDVVYQDEYQIALKNTNLK
jgi:hypothetical protein